MCSNWQIRCQYLLCIVISKRYIFFLIGCCYRLRIEDCVGCGVYSRLLSVVIYRYSWRILCLLVADDWTELFFERFFWNIKGVLKLLFFFSWEHLLQFLNKIACAIFFYLFIVIGIDRSYMLSSSFLIICIEYFVLTKRGSSCRIFLLRVAASDWVLGLKRLNSLIVDAEFCWIDSLKAQTSNSSYRCALLLLFCVYFIAIKNGHSFS